ncbi:hypothetical protein SEUCBS140593_003450 [Sporothrix eucalyptigena]|uniref:Pre-mRNA-splicing factor 38B n=1 Tax=Sporothrix eucalyptigena TaxID=1812306 RepID=A0ABP0BFZ9_9PEZI
MPAPPVRGTRPASKMTPNTRFLRHIVREAESHNAALLARETADAQKRLKRSRPRDSSREDRERERERKDRNRRSRHSHRRDHDSKRDEDSEGKDDRRSSKDKNRQISRSPSRRHSRRRSASPRSSGRHHRDRDYDRDHERTRNRSPDDNGKDGSDYESSASSYSSDDFVGPKLASDRLVESNGDDVGIRIRGRGAHSATESRFSSSMDRHFDADYDPTNDIEHPLPPQRPQVASRALAPLPSKSSSNKDADTEMQDDSRGLLRDSAERLKAAGFTDKEIAILARGGRRQRGYTPWAKRGEEREWDRDKVDGDDGPAKPAWAR